ncbi:hypothetical protein [Paenibacillus sp. Marseille-Q4541]|uniref:hypothetical protein n=1 Tax=Paenibacillus sp. Marseille-Q4541 TaxID=2831522 RepID=UPI001BAC6E23|nr:hypothetical protein [Paenibacillus sp. Marseille-Q4541]
MNQIDEINEAYKCLVHFDKEAGKREFAMQELKTVVTSEKLIQNSIPYLLGEIDRLRKALEEAREEAKQGQWGDLERADAAIRNIETLCSQALEPAKGEDERE